MLNKQAVDLLAEAKLAVWVVAPSQDLTVVGQGEAVVSPDSDINDVDVF